MVQYMSPSSLSLFWSDREGYYMRYLTPNRVRFPQTKAMSAGSAFDAYVKSYLYRQLFGECTPEFELNTIFEKQVEPHNRDWARSEGAGAFMAYKKSGALADLLSELMMASTTPRFESDLTADLFGVPVLGKPDLYYTAKSGMPVILDWKCTGFDSNYAKSPYKGYSKIRCGEGSFTKGCHPEAYLSQFGGLTINSAHPLELVENNWAAQLSIYSWLCGGQGDNFVAAVDQILMHGVNRTIRIVEYRLKPSMEYVGKLRDKLVTAWSMIQSSRLFADTHPGIEESEVRRNLDNRAKILVSTDPDDVILRSMM